MKFQFTISNLTKDTSNEAIANALRFVADLFEDGGTVECMEVAGDDENYNPNVFWEVVEDTP